MTQRLEKDFSKSFHNNIKLMGHKLQVNQMAHHETHSDYELFNKKGYIFFIEAKECKVSEKGYGVFAFDRLTQEGKLLDYHQFAHNMYSYLLISFRKKRLKDSYTFLIPITKYISFKNSIGKKSGNLNDFMNNFSQFRLKVLIGSMYDLIPLE